MRLAAGIALTLLLSTGALAQTAPPAGPTGTGPAPVKRNYTIRGSGLTIDPGQDSFRLRIESGVTISGSPGSGSPGRAGRLAMPAGGGGGGSAFTLSAASVEVLVQTGQVIPKGELKLPKDLPVPKNLLENPAKAATDLARQMQLPRPNFSPKAIQRITASGGIVARSQGFELRTPELTSTDGGQSWLAKGSSVLTSTGKQAFRLSASELLYNTATQSAAARGRVQGRFVQSGQPPLTLGADRLDFDVARQQLSLSGNLRAQFGSLSVSSGPLTASASGGRASTSGAQLSDLSRGIRGNVGSLSLGLRDQRLSATQGVTLSDVKNGLTVSAASVSADLRRQSLSASGGVHASDSKRGVELSAGSLSADLKTRKLVASGNPTVRYGGSTFTGETVTVSQLKGKTVVEVTGEQRARIRAGDVQAFR